MHHEAAVYMAQHLGIPLPGLGAAGPLRRRGETRGRRPARIELGCAGAGFAFDNELAPHTSRCDAFRIDARRSPGRVTSHSSRRAATASASFWSDAGWRWLQQQPLSAPRYVRAAGSAWQRRTFGRWVDVDPACRR